MGRHGHIGHKFALSKFGKTLPRHYLMKTKMLTFSCLHEKNSPVLYINLECQHFYIYEQDKFHSQFYNIEAWSGF